MSKQQPDYPVLIPYSKLCELLEASERVEAYQAEVKRLQEQLLAMRIIQQQCLEQIKELKKLL